MAWFDRPDASARVRLVRELRSVLPAPDPRAPSFEHALAPDAPPEALAEAIREQPGFLWLDGGGGRHLLMADPVARLSVRDGHARVRGPRGSVAVEAPGIDLIEAALEAWGPCRDGLLAGYLGYEIGRDLERLPPPPPDDLGLPDLHLALYDRVVRGRRGEWALSGTAAFRGAAALDAALVLPAKAARAAPDGAPLAGGPVTSRPGPSAYRAAVARTVARIRDGEVFQANLCRRIEAPFDPRRAFDLYRRLRRLARPEYGAFVDLGEGRAVLSASPERFLRVRGRRVESRPIKGTRPRGADPETDRALARALETSAKDRAELSMIVDLGRVCRTGTVEVLAHAELDSLPTVHHTRSTVAGDLRDDVGPADLLRAAFPAGSITGAPKIQAMVIASEEEERRRGPAMGSIGWIAFDGSLDLSVAIRTTVVASVRVAYHAGAGIVARSDPDAELAETRAKARAFLDALGAVEDDA